MGTGANLFFNLISMLFITLTVVIGLGVVMVAVDSMEPPIFAPEPTLEVPPTVSYPTLTPTMMPTVDPNFTPEAMPTGEVVQTPGAPEPVITATVPEPGETSEAPDSP